MIREKSNNLFEIRQASRKSGSLKRGLLSAIALAVTAVMVSGSMIAVVADTGGKASKAPSRLSDDKRIIHLLGRAGFGSRPGDVERVKRMGVDKYLDLQLQPDRINDSAVEARLSALESLHMSTGELYEKYPQPGKIAQELGLRGKVKPNEPPKPADPAASPNTRNQAGSQSDADATQQKEYREKLLAYYADHALKQPQRILQELQAQKLIRAVYSERQLQEVMTDFWFNHFNIFWPKGADRWMTSDFEKNAIRPHTFGKFKDLLMATAKSPAMLFYLDNFLSASPNARRPQPRAAMYRRRPGLFGGFGGPVFGAPIPGQQPAGAQQNQQQKRKAGINENYARELMELHTLGVDGGYTQKDVQEVARCFTGWTIDRPQQAGKFVFRDWMHDDGEKTVLGQKVPAGGGEKDGERVIDILARNPSTAKFISTKLARRFVSDTPPQSLVDRLAATYMKTDGDIHEMLRTIFTSPEFYSPEAYRAKIKSPFELAVSAVRAMGGDTDGSPRLAQLVAKMGEPLYQYQAPTGYPDRAEQWVNTGALLERLNFGLALSANRIPGTTVGAAGIAQGADVARPDRLMDKVIAVLLEGDVSPQTRAILDKQMKEGVPVNGDARDGSVPRIKQADVRADSMDANGTMMAEAPAGKKSGVKGAAAYLKAMRDWPVQAAPQQSIDPQVATAIGLVLGSPEFQRH